MISNPFDPARGRGRELPPIKCMTLDVYKQGFSLQWPYLTDDLQRFQCLNKVKQTAGFEWNKPAKAWVSVGPEVVLDMDRYHVWDFISSITPLAKERVLQFRGRLESILEIKHKKYPGMYGFQRGGTEALVLQERGILADEMGVGKSKQALDACFKVDAQRILILAPKTLVYNWKDEVDKWYQTWQPIVMGDTSRERGEAWEEFEAFLLSTPGILPAVMIVNYEKIRLHDWPFDMQWDVVILDEAHRLKTRSTETHKAAKKLKTKYLWALTGTPLEMKVEELFGIMSLVRPSVFGGLYRFQEQHLVLDAWHNVIAQRNPELLKERIGPWMTRRTKKDVLPQLPPKLYNTVYVDFSKQEMDEYRRMVKQFSAWLKEHERNASEANILTQTLRLQQFTCSYRLLDESPLFPQGYGSKYSVLRDVLGEWDGKAVVFTQFSQMAERLAMGLNTQYLITGDVPAENRTSIVRDFNKEPSARVLISTDAGAYGLNITGADLIIHYSQLWNPAKMWQREDRLHRIGQTAQAVNVVILVVRGTIDEGMLKVLERRRALFSDIVEGAEDVAIKKLGTSMLKKLVEGRLQ